MMIYKCKQKNIFTRVCILFLALLMTAGTLVIIIDSTAKAAEMPPVDFEDGKTGGFTGRGGDKVTVTDEEAHSGTYSLLSSGRDQSWNGPSLEVTNYVEPGVSYNVSVWVKAKSPASSQFMLSTQVGQGDGASYYNITTQNIGVNDGWVELKGSHIYGGNTGYITIYVENSTPTAEYYIDDVSFTPASSDGIDNSIAQPSLHETYKDYFIIGSAFEGPDLIGKRFDLISRHFNMLTFGNSMKPDALGGRQKGSFNFNRVDGIIDILDDAGILLHGHTLVWHSQSAAWLNTASNGSPLTREEARENLEYYISNVAGHYAGRVVSWDVLNEAFADYLSSVPADWRTGLRTTSMWYRAYANGAGEGEHGADYIYDAFVYARLADPGATLYYNDFNEESRGKREAIAAMTEELNAKWLEDPRNTQPGRLLIEGLGMQAHYWTDSLNPKDVEDTIIRWIETGAEIAVTELDIPTGNYTGFKPIDEALEQKQAELYAKLFQIYKKYSDYIVRVSVWGIDDPTSWRREGSPLLFDAEGYPKKAFFAVLDPDGFLGGTLPDTPVPPADTTEPPQTPDENPETSAPAGNETPSPTPASNPGDTTEPDNNQWLIITSITGGVIIIGTAVFVIIKTRRNNG